MKSMIVMALSLSAVAACGTSAPEATKGASADVSSVAPVRTDAQTADAQAKLALSEVARLVPGSLAVESLELSEGFQLRYLNHVALASWSGQTAEQLSLAVNDRVYAVSQNGNVVGSITMHKGEGGWETSAVGQGAASAKLTELRNTLRASHTADGDTYELVHVLGLNDRFIGHHEQGRGYLTSLKADADKTARPEADVFAELSVRARNR